MIYLLVMSVFLLVWIGFRQLSLELSAVRPRLFRRYRLGIVPMLDDFARLKTENVDLRQRLTFSGCLYVTVSNTFQVKIHGVF